jgi:hypothetical protein
LSSRDKDIQRVFEIADDSLQGILGYHLYVIAMQSASNIEKIAQYLPDKAFQMTFEWIRYYQKEDLIQAFTPPLLEFYQSRISLTSLVTVFEVALDGFINNLAKKGYIKKLKNQRFVKNCIEWAYDQLSPCHVVGNDSMVKRLPVTFGIIDNARRLRNLIIHRQGLFDDSYEEQVIHFKDIVVDMHPQYSQHKANPQKPFPVLIDTPYFFYFSMAHLEVLHLLHNEIQKRYFGPNLGYDYRVENKAIEWNRALWGSAEVKSQSFQKSTMS